MPKLINLFLFFYTYLMKLQKQTIKVKHYVKLANTYGDYCYISYIDIASTMCATARYEWM